MRGTVYIYSTMARTKYCPVCAGDHFRKICVTLPSGKTRDTDLVYCCRCELTFYRPPEKAQQPKPAVKADTSKSAARIPFLACIPAADISLAMAKLPDCASAKDDVCCVTVNTASLSPVQMTFERKTAKHHRHRFQFWNPSHAEKIVGVGPDRAKDDIET